jgi:hypothetical protein
VLCILSLAISCGEPIGGSNKSPVMLVVKSQEDPYAVWCDVYSPSALGNVENSYHRVIIEAIWKNQGEIPTTEFADILLKEQRVHFFRFDGNPDVPDPFMILLPNNTIPAGGELNLEIVVVPREAKLKSPLKDLAFGGGEGAIQMGAVVEFFGEDLMGNKVSADITLLVFAEDMPG